MSKYLIVLILCSAWARADNFASDSNALERVHLLAQKEGFDEAYLQSLLLAVAPDVDVLKKITTPAEKKLTWGQYRAHFLTPQRIQGGQKFWAEHEATLAQAARDFGVDPAIIVAILGVETLYGRFTGKTGAFQALSTLCFHYPPRARFFCSQWDDLLRLARRENLNPLAIKGSYAGALGMAQFMPESYLKDAIDYNHNDKVNLWLEPEDAIGSIANYLKRRGWQPGAELATPLSGPPARQDTDVLQLQGATGAEYWHLGHNFRVIARYNSSPLYVMAVIELAAALRNQREPHEL